MRLQSGGEELIREAAALDPDFAVAHAALAMLGHEAGADVDVRASLEAAREAVRRRGDAREAQPRRRRRPSRGRRPRAPAPRR